MRSAQAQLRVVERIDVVVTAALEQYDAGYAVDVEARVVAEAKRIIELVSGLPSKETQT